VGHYREIRDRTYDIVILDVIGFTPRAHDEGIIECNAGNDIDTFALQRRQILDETRKMFGRATRSESAGNGKDDDLLISPLCREKSAEVWLGRDSRVKLTGEKGKEGGDAL
jgi:hypothetical protein